MSGIVSSAITAPRNGQRVTAASATEAPWVRRTLIGLALVFLTLFLLSLIHI